MRSTTIISLSTRHSSDSGVLSSQPTDQPPYDPLPSRIITTVPPPPAQQYRFGLIEKSAAGIINAAPQKYESSAQAILERSSRENFPLSWVSWVSSGEERGARWTRRTRARRNDSKILWNRLPFLSLPWEILATTQRVINGRWKRNIRIAKKRNGASRINLPPPSLYNRENRY